MLEEEGEGQLGERGRATAHSRVHSYFKLTVTEDTKEKNIRNDWKSGTGCYHRDDRWHGSWYGERAAKLNGKFNFSDLKGMNFETKDSSGLTYYFSVCSTSNVTCADDPFGVEEGMGVQTATGESS